VLAALIKKEGLARKAHWPMALFLDSARATIVKQNVPHQVPSVSNYRAQGQTFVAQVSGGVVIDPWQVLKHNEYRQDTGGQLQSARHEALTEKRPEDHHWWWD